MLSNKVRYSLVAAPLGTANIRFDDAVNKHTPDAPAFVIKPSPVRAGWMYDPEYIDRKRLRQEEPPRKYVTQAELRKILPPTGTEKQHVGPIKTLHDYKNEHPDCIKRRYPRKFVRKVRRSTAGPVAGPSKSPSRKAHHSLADPVPGPSKRLAQKVFDLNTIKGQMDARIAQLHGNDAEDNDSDATEDSEAEE